MCKREAEGSKTACLIIVLHLRVLASFLLACYYTLDDIPCTRMTVIVVRGLKMEDQPKLISSTLTPVHPQRCQYGCRIVTACITNKICSAAILCSSTNYNRGHTARSGGYSE
jgi:hypothetical protein